MQVEYSTVQFYGISTSVYSDILKEEAKLSRIFFGGNFGADSFVLW